MTKKEAEYKSKVKCHDCKRTLLSHPDLYFIKWLTRGYTCFDCIETAYFQMKIDISSNKRAK